MRLKGDKYFLNLTSDNAPAHPAYNPFFSAYFFVGTVFFSHNKSVNGICQPAYQHSRTEPT
jgi:hypothetical protein